MSSYSIQSQYPIFLDQSGKALNLGKLYIGLPNEDPQTSPKDVFWDKNGTDPVDQTDGVPIIGGYIIRSGTPATIYIDGDYSIRLRDRFGAQVYAIANAGGDLAEVAASVKYLDANNYPYPINVYTESDDPTGGGPVGSTALVVRSLGTHTDPRYGHHIHVVSDGSGEAAAPSRADFSFGVTAIRTEWQTNDTPGEIDGIGVVAINGVGDVAGVLVDVGSREGFSAVLEGASRQYLPDGSATHKLRVQLGVVDSLTDTQLGIAIVADTGVNDVAVYAASGGGSFSKMLQFIEAGITTFQIDPDGSYWSTGNAVIGLNVGTDDVGTTVGLGRTADGNSYHDLVTDTTYTDFGARFGRNAGANGTTIIGHRGTGALQMKLYEAGNFLIEINGNTFFGVESDGAIVMGAHTPAADAPSNGYIEIKDRLGNVHKLSTRA
ncbi:hypothetical protein CJD35_13710 [Sphingobium xenophagum]|uniref:Uncharacterized protein n=1 Tax=Sphingobium xenophagum TaxID=121428 RepID=A0A249MVQ8_SPHXE|nr:hypothetical protein [Sphingobium xenophagum]ASY45372.1 hypothetical protein CJD35_13710 [Sphingobium xenophagum]